MMFLRKKTSGLVRASFVFLLLAHVATSCKSKVEAFKFRDHETDDPIESSPVVERQDGNIQLREILKDNVSRDDRKQETVHTEVERRNEKAITQTRKIKFEETNQDVTPNQRNTRKIVSPSNIGAYHCIYE